MNFKINFFKENVSFQIRKRGEIRKWISTVIDREGKEAQELNFIFCDDNYLSELNFKYLRHKTLTDILTFSLNDGESGLNGDIFISIQRVKENAVKFNQRIEDELHRVMIHGILHLIGYKDKSRIEKIKMREKEDFYLELFLASASKLH
jgi:probable rRNA maturation factor